MRAELATECPFMVGVKGGVSRGGWPRTEGKPGVGGAPKPGYIPLPRGGFTPNNDAAAAEGGGGGGNRPGVGGAGG